jgi:hypothetical protein
MKLCNPVDMGLCNQASIDENNFTNMALKAE